MLDEARIYKPLEVKFCFANTVEVDIVWVKIIWTCGLQDYYDISRMSHLSVLEIFASFYRLLIFQHQHLKNGIRISV